MGHTCVFVRTTMRRHSLRCCLWSHAANQQSGLRRFSSPGEWRTFEGTWSASGTRQTLNLETNHRASIFDLTGSLLLTGDRGLGVGFQAKAIGFSDSLAGMQGRCCLD